MRISDWSSDVCSSDLRELRGPGQQGGRAFERRDAEHCTTVRYAISRRRTARSSCARRRGAEIGRASCRERVCQYVLISVVAVTLKKKEDKHLEVSGQ